MRNGKLMVNYNNYSLENMLAASVDFQKAYPAYRQAEVHELRSREYARLDEQKQVYLDYTGSGLYAISQLKQHSALLAKGVFGNPHSVSELLTQKSITCSPFSAISGLST